MVRIKRVYDAPSPEDGTRVLCDRLWPRGLNKERAAVEIWLKEIGPTTELRKWFNHDPNLFAEFSRRYEQELAGNESQHAALVRLREIVKSSENVTLLFSAKDEEHNNVIVIESLLARASAN